MLEANTKKWENAVLEKGIEKGIDIGIEKGIEKGIMKRDVEITEKMIANNMSNEDIRKITGMSLSKINALRKNLKR